LLSNIAKNIATFYETFTLEIMLLPASFKPMTTFLKNRTATAKIREVRRIGRSQLTLIALIW
jgi:hypothetical protein